MREEMREMYVRLNCCFQTNCTYVGEYSEVSESDGLRKKTFKLRICAQRRRDGAA